MASAGLEILGMILTVAGWLGVMVACCLPMWRVAAYIGQNIVITQIVWEGLWMSCVVQSTGQMHCRVYDSMLGLSDDLQAARALTVVSTLLGVLGTALAVAGAKCTNCTSDAANKPRIMLAAGVTFITCGLLLLVAVCWTANGIILDFHNPLLEETQKRDLFLMAALGLEILGVTLAVFGWIVGIVSCALPMWKVTAFIGVNIVTAQTIWEGIWMNCVVQSTGQMQCKVYDSMLALSSDLQAARALCVIAIVMGVLGLLLSIMGAKCTKCLEEERAKSRVMIAAGVTFICAAVMHMIPVCWSAHSIIRSFYNPVIIEAQKREIGASLYLGWASSALLLIGGGILCCSCPPREENRYGPPSRMVYSAARSVPPAGFDKRDYV
ncbi:claudin-4-like isoform X2 [Onychostoma macrolepis]|uniref:claudin-4-like isoform X2 n=1 Tax=Onychostoma macrolepis TaxID=369639 RepID=UPI00272960BD|nr:claudin-4-like isoform X2 [Onychostoma macrolepis]